MPDKNIDWEQLPPTHTLFTTAYYQEIKSPPSGMNYYQEPVECLKFYGEIAILYTANDYGDMWRFGITPTGQFDLSRDENRHMIAMDEDMWNRRNIYYRNINRKDRAGYLQFGTNIIIHLLTRWENKTATVSASSL